MQSFLRCSEFIGWIGYFIFICTYCKLCKYLYFYKKKRLYWPNFVCSSESIQIAHRSNFPFTLSVQWEKTINTLMLFVKKDDWDFFFNWIYFCTFSSQAMWYFKSKLFTYFFFFLRFELLFFIAATKYQKWSKLK